MVITEKGDEEGAINSIYRGADGCIVRGVLLELLDNEIYYAMKKKNNNITTLPENTLKDEIRNIAADDSLTEKEFINKALKLVGPAARVSRYSYDRRIKSNFVVDSQWCDDGVESTMGLSLPANVVKLLIKDKVNQMDKESFFAKIPPGIKDLMVPFYKYFTYKLDIESMLVIPHMHDDKMVGIVSFDICRSNNIGHVWTDAKKKVYYEITQLILDEVSKKLDMGK